MSAVGVVSARRPRLGERWRGSGALELGAEAARLRRSGYTWAEVALVLGVARYQARVSAYSADRDPARLEDRL